MKYFLPDSVANGDCECGTGQTKSTIACPVCHKFGSAVNFITPQNTLIKDARTKLNSEHTYDFCDNPECDVVYYNESDTSVFTTLELKNRVTIKDDSPKTPLCYCFKVLKKHALEEIARFGTTDIFNTIQAKMKPGQSCFCEKSNPRGDTCVQDIQHWLEKQGVATKKAIEEPTESRCCEQKSVKDKTASSCYDTGTIKAKTNSACC